MGHNVDTARLERDTVMPQLVLSSLPQDREGAAPGTASSCPLTHVVRRKAGP